MRLAKGRSGDVLSTRGTAVFGVALLLLTLYLLRQGWCDCTLFALNTWALIGTAVLLLGNRSFGVLAEEKEKKTLDCLRLTQLSPSALFWYKLSPEFRSLARLLAFTAPSVLLSSYYTSSGLSGGAMVMGIAALAGVMSIVSSLFVSSLATSTSRAVVQGWTLKACWLLLTPVFDLVVSAVTVTTQRYPVFDAVNPFAAVWPLVVPEAEMGLRQQLPLAFVLLGTALTVGMWMIAARRYERGLTAAPTLTDRQVHRLYQQTPGWVPGFLGVRENPVFLRELAAQLRSGAGKWPGYAVFVTLFLAPFLYSQSWNVRRSSEIELSANRRLRVSSQQSQSTIPAPEAQLLGVEPMSPTPYIRLRSSNNEELRLKGHTNCACLRMGLYQTMHIPLPASEVVKVTFNDPNQIVDNTSSQGDVIAKPGPAEVPLTGEEARQFGVSSNNTEIGNTQLSADTLNQIRLHSMGQGLLGCLVLLSLYLCVRCSGFLANAVTSECDRRSWTDLALSGLEPEQVLRGKLAGTLLMPVIQLLVASPSLLLFVMAGALTPQGMFQLVSYSVVLTVTSGLLGFWASSASKTSHSAQGLALAAVMGWLVGTPLLVSLGLGSALMFPLAGMGLLALSRGCSRGVSMGWFALAFGALVSPLGLSPWTCLPTSLMAGLGHSSEATALLAWMSGMFSLVGLASVCYASTLANLQQPGQTDALRADRVA